MIGWDSGLAVAMPVSKFMHCRDTAITVQCIQHAACSDILFHPLLYHEGEIVVVTIIEGDNFQLKFVAPPLMTLPVIIREPQFSAQSAPEHSASNITVPPMLLIAFA
jgi:hypothetical protein